MLISKCLLFSYNLLVTVFLIFPLKLRNTILKNLMKYETFFPVMDAKISGLNKKILSYTEVNEIRGPYLK